MFRIILFLAIVLLPVTARAGDLEALEKAVIERAESDPETAEDYFISRIEAGATYEEQAVYVYGIGVAWEKRGNLVEAIHNYIAAEALGSAAAARALQRLRGKP